MGRNTAHLSRALLTVRQRVIAGHQIAVVRDMVGEQRAQAFDVVAPVAVQFAGDAEPGHQLRAGGFHAAPGRLTRQLIEGAGGVGHHKDLKAFIERRQRRECHAHFGHHAGDDQLLTAGGFTALTKSSLSQALIWPGRGMKGASGNWAFSSGTSGPLGPFSKLVVRMVGRLKYFAKSPSASTLF